MPGGPWQSQRVGGRVSDRRRAGGLSAWTRPTTVGPRSRDHRKIGAGRRPPRRSWGLVLSGEVEGEQQGQSERLLLHPLPRCDRSGDHLEERVDPEGGTAAQWFSRAGRPASCCPPRSQRLHRVVCVGLRAPRLVLCSPLARPPVPGCPQTPPVRSGSGTDAGAQESGLTAPGFGRSRPARPQIPSGGGAAHRAGSPGLRGPCPPRAHPARERRP